jgi:hypothetical protein
VDEANRRAAFGAPVIVKWIDLMLQVEETSELDRHFVTALHLLANKILVPGNF